MWKLGLLRAVITSNVAARMAVAQNRTLPSVLYEPARRLSTEAEKPPQDSAVRSASGAFAVRLSARRLTDRSISSNRNRRFGVWVAARNLEEYAED